MKISEKIKALPWKGNALDIVEGSSLSGEDNSLYGQASRWIAEESDPDEAWEGEKALHLCCFGETLGDGSRAAWEAERRQ